MEMDNKSINKMATLTPAADPDSASKIIKKPVEEIPEENIASCAATSATDKNLKIELTPTAELGVNGDADDDESHNKRKADALIIDLTSDNENEDCPTKREKVEKSPKEETPPDANVKNDSQTSSVAASLAESLRKLFIKLSNTHEDLIAYRDSIMKNPGSSSMTTIECRSIRVGSYKTVAILVNINRDEFLVDICEKGICFELPHATEKNKRVTCALPIRTIVSVYAHFGPRLPVLFIKTSPLNADWLREKLGMGNIPDHPFYYHLDNGGKKQRAITFLPKSFSESDKRMLKKLFPYNMIEMDHLSANNYLMDVNPDTPLFYSAQTYSRKSL